MKTNQPAALLCETDMRTDELGEQGKEMKLLCPTVQGWPCSAGIPCARRGWEGREPNQPSLDHQQNKGATCSLQSWSKFLVSSEAFPPFSVDKAAQEAELVQHSHAEQRDSASAESCCLTPTNAAASQEIWPQLDPLKACKCWSSLMS